MASSNLEALNALIEKIRAGEGTAKSNLEALNMLCVIAGGTGAARSNLEALNELLRVFTPGGETQEKSVTITENGTTEIIPDEGFTLSKAVIETAVPSKPEQTKAVTITENGTTEITPDAGFTLSGASVSVSVTGESGYNVNLPTIDSTTNQYNCVSFVTEIDLTRSTVQTPSMTVLNYFFNNLNKLKKIIWGDFPNLLTSNTFYCNSMYNNCKELETINMAAFGNRIILSADSMFSNCYALKNINFGSIKFNADMLTGVFYGCRTIETIDTSFIDENYTGVKSIQSCFRECRKLVKIDLAALKTEKITKAGNAFDSCAALTNIIFENECFSNTEFNSISFYNSPLTHDCAVDIFNKLAIRDNSPSMRLSSITKGYLTDDEIAIATNKGWVIS